MARDPSFLHMDTWLANFKELLRWRFKMNFLYWVYFKFWNSWSLLRQVRELIIQYLRTFVGWGGVGGGREGGFRKRCSDVFQSVQENVFLLERISFYGSRLLKFCTRSKIPNLCHLQFYNDSNFQ